MASALAASDITLWYKTKTATDPESGEEVQAIIRQEALGWNVDSGVMGIFVDESKLYMVPLSELEGILVEYREVEDGMGPTEGVDESTIRESGEESGPEAKADGKATVYVPNFGGGSKDTE